MGSRFSCLLLTVLFLISISPLHAQKNATHTLSYADSIGSPKATITDVAWIAGHWKGEAFGGQTEELWTPPLGNSMMCVFKLVSNNKVEFYEICTISEENGTLVFRLKHFHENLNGWEKQNEKIESRLVKLEQNKAYFDGFTFERVSQTELNIYVVIHDKGKTEEVKFAYTNQ
ncbi:hypothetical protein EP331_09110 [bacterium]|nr:MAG: hypothetical protein EP331_09110 [bacterium]